MGLGAFHPRQILFTRERRFVAAVADRGCRSQRLRLQRGALQKNGADSFHLIQRAIDVAGFKLNSAAAIQDNVSIQAEVAGVEGAVFDAVIQGQTHQVDVLD